ncbi:cyclic nucleotide-binding domain-containing protein [Roseofilum capinflatum]|uniref:Cyclic nucleotide-binding domain-containing protein n=1 Tax=Roseofilum capinflatum BLCC-M114 TaxID=3022440 RepID=A0ABT7BCP1_9CYAN|nr:cyclic nucleotide-binding domain-containing protein [Roseofilum capinflatum]MDJ1176949.1 cyclic nucleotide-binding domain-containing protein [Roseofilum capinflatum BLCC-M114]
MNENLEIKGIVELLENIGVSKCLNDRTREPLMASLEAIDLEPLEVLFREAEKGDALYLVAEGELEVYKGDELNSPLILGRIQPGEWVGELQVLLGGKRTASIRSLTASQVIRFPKTNMVEAIAQCPELGQYFLDLVQHRLREQQMTAFFSQTFGYLEDDCMQELKAKAEWVQLRRGECLCRQGEAGDSLYWVLHGRFNTLLEDDRGEIKVLGTIGSGEIIGELSVITHEPRSASVYALRDSLLIRYRQADFQVLIQQYPVLLLKTTERLIKRFKQRERESGVVNPKIDHQNIAILPIHEPTSFREFTESLVAALSSHGEVLHLNRDRLAEILDFPDIADVDPEEPRGVRLQLWLEEQEKQYRFIIFEGDGSDSPWTQRCIRQADHLVWVALSSADPGLTPLEERVQAEQNPATTREQSLILIHENTESLPTGTRFWLEPRTLSLHHHVRSQHQGDIERIGRFLAGCAIGLALGGGGGRGMAHIGVFHALEMMGIPIDFIGGTSMGSLLAAEYAMGSDIPTMIARGKENTAKNNPFTTVTIPVTSFLSHKKFDRGLKWLYGDIRIEDLWINFFACSTNITTGQKKVHRRGLVWQAIRASAALPGAFIPFIDNGELFIDGGVVDNDPSLTMKELHSGPIILSSVAPWSMNKIAFSYEDFPSPWQILWSRINPGMKPIECPGLMDFLGLSMGTKSLSNLQKTFAAADIVLTPPLQDYPVFEVSKIDELIEIGREYTLEQLKDRPELGH